ncbi:MAG TPA: hypothetical protein VGL27_17230 [Negativicutes bacterium]|jgi:hypothetical protein
MSQRLHIVSNIASIVTSQYPIRDVALANHGVWIEHEQPQCVEGFEYAIYYEPYQNIVFPEVLDAISIEILFHDNEFLFSGYATRPDNDRNEFKITKTFTSYQDAKRTAIHWLPKAHKFITTRKLALVTHSGMRII